MNLAANNQTNEGAGVLPRYSKLDWSGHLLPESATQWAAVLDSGQGLIWSGNLHRPNEAPHAANQVGDEYAKLEWLAADLAARSLRMFHRCDWRLPTISEWLAMIDRRNSSPAIDAKFLPTMVPSRYWTSSAFVGSPDEIVWTVALERGECDTYLRRKLALARAVCEVAVEH